MTPDRQHAPRERRDGKSPCAPSEAPEDDARRPMRDPPLTANQNSRTEYNKHPRGDALRGCCISGGRRASPSEKEGLRSRRSSPALFRRTSPQANAERVPCGSLKPPGRGPKPLPNVRTPTWRRSAGLPAWEPRASARTRQCPAPTRHSRSCKAVRSRPPR